jgi:hypothetical protein
MDKNAPFRYFILGGFFSVVFASYVKSPKPAIHNIQSLSVVGKRCAKSPQKSPQMLKWIKTIHKIFHFGRIFLRS